MKKIALILTLCLTFSPTLSQAALFSDNFNNDTLGLNQTTFNGGWTVSGGAVDLIGKGDPIFNFFPGSNHGRYVDLDGSISQAGSFQKELSLIGGQEYKLDFDLAGSQRGSSEQVLVVFGSAFDDFTVNSNEGFSTHTISFTPGVTDTYSLIFQNAGGDDVGALLDNVSVVAIPEPETYAMLLAGLGLLSLTSLRRKTKTQL